MPLAPVLRMLCFALASGGLLQLLLEFACWRIAPRIQGSSSSTPARTLERRLLAFTLAARLLPWIVALGLLTPAYLRTEDNTNSESVSIFCILAGVIIALWIVSTLIRAVFLSWLTRQLCSACHASGQTIEGRALFLHRGSSALIAVMGIFRPRLLISESLLQGDNVSASALEIALDHELAHALQKDNLKLLLLALLPSLAFSSKRLPSIDERWRLAAELAADDESAQGDPERSIQLAELLVKLARQHSFLSTPRLATLLSAPRHLAIRVEYLLNHTQPPPIPSAHSQLRSAGWIFTVVSGVAVVYLSLTFGHAAAEVLLHLGS